MEFTIYYINFKNVEGDDIQIQVKRLQSEPETTLLPLQGSESPAILETVDQDEDKTKSVRGRRLTIGFNSYVDPVYANADNFATDDIDLQGKIITDTSVIPFLGNIVKRDISEAFQPRPNVVTLAAGDGFGTLKEIELTESDGDVPVGHYRLIDYITLCLRHINFDELPIFVAMNLYEDDTDPDTSHAFFDTFLDARTFETNANERDKCFTVLEKIFDAFGCFITFDDSRYYIIRLDEWDSVAGDVTTLRFAEFDFEGAFVGYQLIDVDKNIAHDGSLEYEGFRLSMDNAKKWYQIKAQEVKHIYRFQQPKEVPCNSAFLRGTVDDDVLPLKTYDPECWVLRRGVPGSYSATSIEMKIAVHFDANDYEDERYLYLTPEGTHSGSSTDQTYAESQEIDVHEKDKFEVSVNWRLEANADFGASYNLMKIYLKGDDGSHWLLGNTTIADPTTPLKWWDTSNFTVNTGAGSVEIDFTLIEETEWQTQEIPEVPAIPVDGKLYIWLHQINQTGVSEDNQTINYADLRFTYIAFINGTYHRIEAQEHNVTGNQSKIFIEKEMFISDSPKKLFKGALKKFDGTNYVLTEGWSYYIDPTVLPGERLAKHIVFQWWNQYRTTRAVIESSIQGLTDNIPSLINRWRIYHGNQDEKYFMLTSFTDMNFYNCGWRGVFVETSNGAGNRLYSDQWNFKYIQE